MAITFRETDGTTTTHHAGRVLMSKGEHNLAHDSYFYALVWDEEQRQVIEVEYGATAYASTGRAETDATREVIEKAVAVRAAAYLEEWEAKHNATVRHGMAARVTVRGEGELAGTVEWIGEARAYSAWDAKYGKRRARYGVKVEGRKGFIFRNEGSPSLVVDVPGWTEEDRAEMTAKAEARARHDFREAIQAADERDPRPAAPEPGTVVDAQEADEDGMRLYAVGESFCEDAWARGVAEAVIDETAAGYAVLGKRRDGSQMALRECTVFQALGYVARWVENDGAMVAHDGRGVVRIVRADGACLFLAPTGGQEAAGAPQEGGERQEVAEGVESAQGGRGARLVERTEERREYPATAGNRGCERRTVRHWYSDGTRVRFVLDAYDDGERLARVTRFPAGYVAGVDETTRRRATWWAPQEAEEAPEGEPCPNCGGGVAEGQEEAHGAPCAFCGSDGHAGCQHVHAGA